MSTEGSAQPAEQRSSGAEPRWIECQIEINRGTPSAKMAPAQQLEGIKGLAITQIASQCWTVTHVESGLRISAIMGRGEARRLLCLAAPIIDWTLPRDQITPLLSERDFVGRMRSAAIQAGHRA